MDRDTLTSRYWQARYYLESIERDPLMLTPYKNKPLPSGALVSLSYQEMQDAANALWNLVAVSDEIKKMTLTGTNLALFPQATAWVDVNHNGIQTVHDKLIHALASLDAAEKAGG
jgi:hypothetical protein